MTRYIFVLVICVTALSGSAPAARVNGMAEVCYSTRDEISGKNRICYYKCPSGEVAITISDTKRCPVNITR